MRYDICIKSFINTDGRVLSTTTNEFNATLKSRIEAGALTLQVLNDAYGHFGMLPDFEIEGSPKNEEIHIVVRAFNQVLITVDAVPARMIRQRGEPSKDAFVVPSASRVLN